jgi:hypothetical protein
VHDAEMDEGLPICVLRRSTSRVEKNGAMVLYSESMRSSFYVVCFSFLLSVAYHRVINHRVIKMCFLLIAYTHVVLINLVPVLRISRHYVC